MRVYLLLKKLSGSVLLSKSEYNNSKDVIQAYCQFYYYPQGKQANKEGVEPLPLILDYVYNQPEA